MHCPDYVVKNLKIHVYSQPLNLQYLAEKIQKHHRNFITLRQDHYAFVVFEKRGYVNISGIRGFSDIIPSLKAFQRLTGVKLNPSGIHIDNSTSCGAFIDTIDISKLVKTVASSKVAYIRVRPHYFPAALIRPFDRKKFGSIILFRNGKFIIVGPKSRVQIEETRDLLCHFIGETVATV